ncbi:MAG: hypothetical protein A3C58_02000 [Candidatus Staskawiczbacteria bacterium RIFCSPHIGHO2_02_FULL_34_10]|uniref:PrgI family protein n=1 Tax=Candidatus Staskawiczbacteria bacterium RIFCSPHIGHO2_02_FULL_34_10 TaxID=1802205 RepID=A0A1G2HYD6_9BACT|nr:MAG: hypothetical protein A3C58_02000 [Candidatus Staskawiczbacteria bacterium RIFCSPHIGHO2_02_FULL_34_10]
MAQYPIPQFIEKEGKIISFLTFRQFFLLAGGGGACLLLYFILPFFLFALCAIIIMSLVAIIAFLRVNGFSIITIFLNFVGFLTGSKTYIWKKEESSYPFKVLKRQEVKSIEEVKTPSFLMKSKASKLNEIKKMVELKK